MLGTSASTAMQADAIQGLRPEGRLVVMCVESTPLTIPVGELIMKRATIIGSQHNDLAYLHEALDLVARGKAKVMTEIYPPDEATMRVSACSRARFAFAPCSSARLG